MKTVLSLLFTLLLSFPSILSANNLKLGEPLSLTEVTKISEINAHPEKYLGKKVLVEGLIIDVCATRGCWLDIASDVPFEKIKIKVIDGEIVFPMEAKGKLARVEGVPEEIKLTKKQAIKMAKHHAEEQGTAFDPASVTGPVRFYRIRGLGAEIE